MKYVAIKVAGLNHWLWFKKENTKEENGDFTGTGGCEEGRAHIETFTVYERHIEGKMETDTLMYN